MTYVLPQVTLGSDSSYGQTKIIPVVRNTLPQVTLGSDSSYGQTKIIPVVRNTLPQVTLTSDAQTGTLKGITLKKTLPQVTLDSKLNYTYKIAKLLPQMPILETTGGITIKITSNIKKTIYEDCTISVPIYMPNSTSLPLNRINNKYKEFITKKSIDKILLPTKINSSEDYEYKKDKYKYNVVVTNKDSDKYIKYGYELYNTGKIALIINVDITNEYGHIIPFAPNRGTYNEKYTTKTSVFRTTSGIEKRTNRLPYLIKESNYSLTLNNKEDIFHMKNIILNNSVINKIQPQWAFANTINSNTFTLINNTSTQIPIQSADVMFTPNEFVVIMANEQLFSTYLITSVTSTYIIVNGIISLTGNLYIIPAFSCTINERTISYDTSTSSEYSITVTEI